MPDSEKMAGPRSTVTSGPLGKQHLETDLLAAPFSDSDSGRLVDIYVGKMGRKRVICPSNIPLLP